MERMHIRLGVYCLIVGLLMGAPRARADNLIAHASKDTTLYEDAAGGIAGGKGVDFFVGRLGTLGNGALRRAPIAFDLSGIPTGATITSVTLTLTQQKGNGGPQPIDLHRLTSDWGEGTSTGGPQGSLATTNDATWTFNFFNTSNWNNAGGDFSATVSGTASADFSGPVIWNSTPQMVSDVQTWMNNPATNFGWILLGNEGMEQTAKEFASRDNFLGQPQLAVTFSVPEPASAVLFTVAGAIFLARRRHRAA